MKRKRWRRIKACRHCVFLHSAHEGWVFQPGIVPPGRYAGPNFFDAAMFGLRAPQMLGFRARRCLTLRENARHGYARLRAVARYRRFHVHA